VIRNILWKVDGVLFDTYPAITYAISKSLNEMGESLALNVIDKLVRESIDLCLDTLSLRFKLDPKLLRDKFTDAYREIDPVNQPPFPYVRELCERIHARGGINIAIANQNLSAAQILLEEHALAPYFTDTVSMKESPPHKSNAKILFSLQEKYQLNAVQTALITNNESDMRAGQDVGLRVCLYRNADTHLQADVHISEYSQLLEKISGH
jgi:phosphoglycolate phosphatase-like HAD superfamily hydrolase